MRLLLHGAGSRPSRPLQPGPHHLPAQAGGPLLPGLLQHVTPEGLPAPVRPEGTFPWTQRIKRARSWSAAGTSGSSSSEEPWRNRGVRSRLEGPACVSPGRSATNHTRNS